MDDEVTALLRRQIEIQEQFVKILGGLVPAVATLAEHINDERSRIEAADRRELIQHDAYLEEKNDASEYRKKVAEENAARLELQREHVAFEREHHERQTKALEALARAWGLGQVPVLK